MVKSVDEVMANAPNRVVNNGDAECESSLPPMAASIDGSNTAANMANAVPTSSENSSLPDVGSMALVEAAINDLPTTQPLPCDVSDDEATYASQCDEIAEAVVRTGGTFANALHWQKKWLAKVGNIESLIPGDRLELSNDTKPFIN